MKMTTRNNVGNLIEGEGIGFSYSTLDEVKTKEMKGGKR